MRLASAAITAVIAAAMPGAFPPDIQPAPPHQAVRCIMISEEFRGSLKICHYNCGGAPFDMTVRQTDQCPFNP